MGARHSAPRPPAGAPRDSRTDDEERLGIAGDVSDLAIAIENVDGNEHDAELHAGEIEIDQLDAIRQIRADAISFAQTARAQRPRHPVAARFDLAKCERPTFEFERRDVARSISERSRRWRRFIWRES